MPLVVPLLVHGLVQQPVKARVLVDYGTDQVLNRGADHW